MKKYAAIELNSGFVWGLATAATPEQACSLIDEESSRQAPLVFESISYSESRSTAGGFALHSVPADFDVRDGQNAAEIARTSAFPLVGYFREVPRD